MPEDTETTTIRPFLLEAAVFICGALVMSYEIVGARIVAPYLGSSTYIWTSLIGVILGALSLGYWLGGRMADRRPQLRVLSAAIFIAGGLVSLTILVKSVFLGSIARSTLPLELLALFASLTLFAPASVALGFVIPYATKLRLGSLENTGRIVGRLYALSTLGSILGTFAAGFFFIPFVGSTRTLYLIAGALFGLALLISPIIAERRNITALILFAFAVGGSELEAAYLRSVGVVEFDSEYNRIRIIETKDSRTGKAMTAMVIDPFAIQSARFIDSDELVLEYTKFFRLVRHYRPNHRSALMIGGAGYSFPQELLREHPAATIEVVEIDPAMTAAAKAHFRLRPDPRLRIFHEDGRRFINRADAKSYDAVFVDAFGTLFSVPFHLTTVEAVGEIERLLADDGVVIVNIGSALNVPADGFLASTLATYRSVFPFVDVFKVDGDLEAGKVQNLIIVARKAEPELPADPPPQVKPLLANKINTERIRAGQILTDELAPVELFASRAARYR
ncbi:MAG: fused MFS/spermidine synthase [Acidobacteria bacterium]|nr:fused MFS/spermidine synthase [Acidobacteriota bacterium]